MKNLCVLFHIQLSYLSFITSQKWRSNTLPSMSLHLLHCISQPPCQWNDFKVVYTKMQFIRQRVGDFGQYFRLELRLPLTKIYFRKKEHLVRKKDQIETSQFKCVEEILGVLWTSTLFWQPRRCCYDLFLWKRKLLPSESEKLFLVCKVFYVRLYHNLKDFMLNVRGSYGQSVSLHLVLLAVDGADYSVWSLALLRSISFLTDF